MAYTIINRFIPSSSYSLKATYAMSPSFISLHNTYNDASASNEVAYMSRNSNATSFHVAIDDKEVIQAISFNRNAWHTGDGAGAKSGNRTSIGIEICYSKSGGQRYADAEANTIEYTAHLLKQFGWDISRVKFHRDWSGKNCPHRILDEKRGDSFLKAIANRLAELNRTVAHVPTLSPKPSTSSTPTQPTEEGIRMLKSSSATLKNVYIKYLEDAVKAGHIQDKWVKLFKDNQLSIDDAFLLDIHIREAKENKK